MMSNNSANERKGRRVGVYTTLIFHLSVIIILLIYSIGSMVKEETSFVLDFTKQEEFEQEQREIEMKEEVSKEIDDIISSISSSSQVRNVVVDAGSTLRDDRHSNPSEVYEEARELQRKLDASRRDALAEQAAEEAVELPSKNEEKKKQEPVSAYKGPSVISYSLEGRKANNLPVPAYKGFGSGDVCVSITVNQKGRVTSATVVKELSTPDISLHDFALEAARRSRFSASTTAPDSQVGSIVYRFIAQ